MLGDNHSDTATSLDDIGLLFFDQEDYDAARQCYEQAFNIRRLVRGDTHPETAKSLYHLAVLAYFEGNVQEALNLLHQALHIYEKALGADHPETMKLRQRLMEIEQRFEQ